MQAGDAHQLQIAGTGQPAGPGSTRMDHFWTQLGRRDRSLPAAFVGAGAFLVFALFGAPWVGLACALIAACVVAAVCWREASRLAEGDQFAAYVTSRGFSPRSSRVLLGDTPLLSAGYQRRHEHYMEGPLPGASGITGGVAHFTLETRVDKRDRRGRAIPVITPHEFTVVIADLPRAAYAFPGVYVMRRLPRLERGEWIGDERLTAGVLDNSQLASTAELWLRPGQDRELLTRLITPELQRWLFDTELDAGFEYEGGTLVVYSARRLTGRRDIATLLDLAGRVAVRLGEVGEPLSAVEAGPSKAPPTGVTALFPPPPPPTKPVVAVDPEPPASAEPIRRQARGSIPPPTG